MTCKNTLDYGDNLGGLGQVGATWTIDEVAGARYTGDGQ